MRRHRLGVIELDEAVIRLSVIQQSQIVMSEVLSRHDLDAFHHRIQQWPKVSWLIAMTAQDEEWWADRLPPVRLNEASRLQQERLIALDRPEMLACTVIQERLPDGRRDWSAWIGLLSRDVVQEGLSLLPFPCPTIIGVHTLTSLHLALQVERVDALRITLYIAASNALLLIEDQIGLRFRRPMVISAMTTDWSSVVSETRRYWEGSQPPEVSQLPAQIVVWVSEAVDIDIAHLRSLGWQVQVASCSLFVQQLLPATTLAITTGFLPADLQAAHLHQRVRKLGIACFTICVLLTVVVSVTGWRQMQGGAARLANYQQRLSALSTPAIDTERLRETRAPLLAIDEQLKQWPSPAVDWLQLSQALNHFQLARVSTVSWSLMGNATTPVWNAKKRAMHLDASLQCPSGNLLDCNQRSHELLQDLRQQLPTWRATQVKLPLATARQTEISSESLMIESAPIAGYVLEATWR